MTPIERQIAAAEAALKGEPFACLVVAYDYMMSYDYAHANDITPWYFIHPSSIDYIDRVWSNIAPKAYVIGLSAIDQANAVCDLEKIGVTNVVIAA